MAPITSAAVPPEEAEQVTEEDPREGRALIRTIFQALLFELSIVTQPAYQETLLELATGDASEDETDQRHFQPDPAQVPLNPLNRWRL